MVWREAYAFLRTRREVLKKIRNISIVEFKSVEPQLLLDITRTGPDKEAR